MTHFSDNQFYKFKYNKTKNIIYNNLLAAECLTNTFW